MPSRRLLSRLPNPSILSRVSSRSDIQSHSLVRASLITELMLPCSLSSYHCLSHLLLFMPGNWSNGIRFIGQATGFTCSIFARGLLLLIDPRPTCSLNRLLEVCPLEGRWARHLASTTTRVP
ncbi:hypothetical protein CC85DRAFT_151183 [Cutaneotrichosporon oleaginosum]|uniref:Uncharacterized protein n=1 Tax=Cutaneotrichosporon oleaginosum TaxID=879819 RepID=A0A0J0XH49_9TREE|nr:uncharacterized protein CC85DRAFT_151183 [Cutaneotrichosporon oleaginosum]KLT40416.1 hypothetical protein CC85DRAFT_151183 [Cutaneotrichosporon oleaginosum]TXT11381.1 hypothetical protein COLE_01791 [Cutaneotrichosporon oleaginosum]